MTVAREDKTKLAMHHVPGTYEFLYVSFCFKVNKKHDVDFKTLGNLYSIKGQFQSKCHSIITLHSLGRNSLQKMKLQIF